jgi:hypothetical protein
LQGPKELFDLVACHGSTIYLARALGASTTLGFEAAHAWYFPPVAAKTPAELDENFYRDLAEFQSFSGVCESEHYHEVPDSWDLVITDVEGSTEAISKGRYKDVNSAGVASIVIVRNAMKEVDIPYVFGGDGATMLVPSSRRWQVAAALRGLRRASDEIFGLQMRVGLVSVKQLREAGHEIHVAKFAASKDVCFAMLRGDGIDVGEQWIKDPARSEEFHISDEGEVFSDFEGFSCRWQAVPSRNGLVASVIIKAIGEDKSEHPGVYRHILGEITKIVQAIDDGRPVHTKSLKLRPTNSGFDAETYLTAGSKDSPEIPAIRKSIRKGTRIAKVLMATRLTGGSFSGKNYKKELVANTDFRKFDNVLRMHLDLRRGQLDRLKEVLQISEDAGYILYRIHTAQETLMTCVVDSYRGSHAHFVDGAAGGYALAAKRIKAMQRGDGPGVDTDTDDPGAGAGSDP